MYKLRTIGYSLDLDYSPIVLSVKTLVSNCTLGMQWNLYDGGPMGRGLVIDWSSVPSCRLWDPVPSFLVQCPAPEFLCCTCIPTILTAPLTTMSQTTNHRLKPPKLSPSKPFPSLSSLRYYSNRKLAAQICAFLRNLGRNI